MMLWKLELLPWNDDCVMIPSTDDNPDTVGGSQNAVLVFFLGKKSGVEVRAEFCRLTAWV
jgi:hypothetical protein